MTATTAPHLGTAPGGHPGSSPVRFASPLARALLTVIVLIGTALGTLLAAAGPASAHAALTGSTPKDGAVVATAPQEVALTFSEQISMGKDSIRVLDPSGERADRAEVADLSEKGQVGYSVALRSGLPNGTYTVAWQAVSADSHPITGAFTFSIGAPSETRVALPSQEAGGGAVGLLYDISRYAAYTGFVLLTGGSAFVLLCWRRGGAARPVQRLIALGWVTLTASTIATLLLRGPYTASGSLADVFDLSGLPAVLETKTGAALVSRLLLLGAAALFISVLFGAYAKRGRTGSGDEGGAESGGGASPEAGSEAGGSAREKDLTFGLAIGGSVVAAGIAATWALSEHASTGIQTGIAMPVDILHLLGVACWLGGLATLLTALHRVPSIEAAAVRRFSRVAFVSVAVVAATGIYQSWRQVGSWSALTGTAYGDLLLIKIALVVLMLGVAWISRKWTARLSDGAETAVAEPADSTDSTDSTDSETTGSGDADGEAETAETEAETAEAGAPSGTTATASAVVAPERAAQLARQRVAVATAGKRKERAADPVRGGLRRTVLAEAAIAAVLLAVTTALTTTEPGRTEETAAAGAAPGSGAGTSGAGAQGPTELKLPFDTGGVNGKGTVRLTLDPASPGANEMHVWIDNPAGKPMDVPELKVSFTLKAKQIGPLPIVPARLASGHWSTSAVQIPMPGDWLVQVTVRTSDIDQTTIDKNVKVR
ncbi:copper resistance protein CopC [Streptomyces sp. CAU 1734]|uniref:copper resistance CopC/CopD family protein n=1 Tax=Streptomyces sp. CAU 1734 TaxID=3140360 RepID=UPI003260046C